jgi:hypothetical protein
MTPPTFALSDDWVTPDPIERDQITVPGGIVEVVTQLHRDRRVCAVDPDAPPWRFIAGATIMPPGGRSRPRGLTPLVRRAAVKRFRAMLTDRGFSSLSDAGSTVVDLTDGSMPVRHLRSRVRVADRAHPAVAMIGVLPTAEGWIVVAGASVLDHPDDPVDPEAVAPLLSRSIASVSL